MQMQPPPGTPNESSLPQTEPQFNVVIAYEDFAAGRHAKETYDYLARTLGRDLAIDKQMWKFEVLGHPKLREMAARDAAAADLILVSSRGDRRVPPELKSWIDEWADRGAGNAMALVKLSLRDRGWHVEEDAILNYLQAIAQRAGIEFFAQPAEWTERSENILPLEFAERAGPTSSLMAGLLKQGRANCRWGTKP